MVIIFHHVIEEQMGSLSPLHESLCTRPLIKIHTSSMHIGSYLMSYNSSNPTRLG
uniref:Uncharacterized protein n=1 Tax=Physcomitrium patens TaxID=3218 RepID=A0A2K1JWG0_PHYPA|nr:hypothetical protein PHYPA_015644 [Physcomitrium patens]